MHMRQSGSLLAELLHRTEGALEQQKTSPKLSPLTQQQQQQQMQQQQQQMQQQPTPTSLPAHPLFHHSHDSPYPHAVAPATTPRQPTY